MSEELKTLRDLFEEFQEEGEYPEEDEMMNWKTLKAEAVKWWKEKHNFGEDVCCTCEEMWRNFFNINEEDLK